MTTALVASSCQQVMDRAKPMVAQMPDQTKMARAQKQMSEAQTAMDVGKTKSCKMHTKRSWK
jgi:hypothetical protein